VRRRAPTPILRAQRFEYLAAQGVQTAGPVKGDHARAVMLLEGNAEAVLHCTILLQSHCFPPLVSSRLLASPLADHKAAIGPESGE
jgi:hypothetical protein